MPSLPNSTAPIIIGLVLVRTRRIGGPVVSSVWLLMEAASMHLHDLACIRLYGMAWPILMHLAWGERNGGKSSRLQHMTMTRLFAY